MGYSLCKRASWAPGIVKQAFVPLLAQRSAHPSQRGVVRPAQCHRLGPGSDAGEQGGALAALLSSREGSLLALLHLLQWLDSWSLYVRSWDDLHIRLGLLQVGFVWCSLAGSSRTPVCPHAPCHRWVSLTETCNSGTCACPNVVALPRDTPSSP